MSDEMKVLVGFLLVLSIVIMMIALPEILRVVFAVMIVICFLGWIIAKWCESKDKDE